MKLATLLYITNKKNEYLLMERTKNPNKGLMSPPGGKLEIEEAESPSQCAVREMYEECLIRTKVSHWRLKGIVTEKNYPSIGNIMLFLMEYQKTVDKLPLSCNEGTFHFIHPNDFKKHKLPVTDNSFIWKNILHNHSQVFIISLDCSKYPEIKQIN